MHWDTLRHDVLYTLRSFRRDLGFFSAAVLIIALGIGANTAIFSVVNALLFRPLQFPASDRLVWIANTGPEADLSSRTSRVANYADWRSMNRSFEELTSYFAFFDYGSYNLIGVGEPERLVGVGVDRNFLSFLGVRPILGRNFNAEECRWNGTPAVILTHGLWQRRFGADPAVIGRTITLNDRSVAVIGVLPAAFDFASVFTPGSRVDMLMPFPITPETDRWGNTLAVLGRLKPAVTLAQAQAEFDVINQQIRREKRDRSTFGAKLTPLQDTLTARFRRGLLVLLSAVGLVLLIGCTNLSNLLLARAASRRKEMAVRSALGATRSRLIRQMLTESFVLTACGAALGLLLAFVAVRYVSTMRAVSIPLLHTVRIDASALLFTAIAALATAILFGLAPALQTSGIRDAAALKDAGRGLSEHRSTAWTRGFLVVSEVALACVLLVGAGLLIRSLLHVLDVDLGFQPQRAAVWRIESGRKYAEGAPRVAYFDRLVHAVESVPGVESAGLTDALPLSRDRSWNIRPRGVLFGPLDNPPVAHPRVVDWRYLRTMRIPLVAGRLFSAQDTAESEPAIVVNEKVARRLWPGQNPIGQLVTFDNGVDRRVVGVVRNVRHQSLEQEGDLEAYIPISQHRYFESLELVVRTKIPPESVAPAIRASLRSIEPSLPTAQFQSLDELVERAVSPRRFIVLLLGAFALAALILASLGIYGVVSYTVTQRTNEIGIRMALGASPGQVQRHVIRRTVMLAGSGILVGVVGSIALSRLTASLLYGIKPTDTPSFAAAVGVLLAVAVSAAYLPAARASRLDPMSALRTE